MKVVFTEALDGAIGERDARVAGDAARLHREMTGADLVGTGGGEAAERHRKNHGEVNQGPHDGL
jgi:hypothetical protein